MSLPHFGDERKTNLDPRAGAVRPENRCAVLTGTGRSAIAVIGLSGTDAGKILRACFDPATKAELSAGQIRYGDWRGPGTQQTPAESVVVTPLRTGTEGTESYEIHCHGGVAAIERIVGDLQACGADRTEASFAFSMENLIISEAQYTLSNCLTERIAAIAMHQVRGALADWTVAWIEVIDSMSPGTGSADLSRLQREAETILNHAWIGVRLAEPFRVVLVGPPNVGKSSLVNAIVGYDRSITFDQAGTTRDVLHADTVIDGIPIRLSDTAGIRASEEIIEQQGVARARVAAGWSDLLLIVTSPEATSPLSFAEVGSGSPDEDLSGKSLQILNKCDLIDSQLAAPAADLATNALNGEGIPNLLQAIADRLSASLPPLGDPLPLCQRQVDCLEELVRLADPIQIRAVLKRLIGASE